jgi:flagellin-specific chaperone FliS
LYHCIEQHRNGNQDKKLNLSEAIYEPTLKAIVDELDRGEFDQELTAILQMVYNKLVSGNVCQRVT